MSHELLVACLAASQEFEESGRGLDAIIASLAKAAKALGEWKERCGRNVTANVGQQLVIEQSVPTEATSLPKDREVAEAVGRAWTGRDRFRRSLDGLSPDQRRRVQPPAF